jgi:hypothetical protein
VDFQFRYNGELMDSPTLSLEEYDIPATGIIQIEEKNFTVTVVLPTGNEKLFNISKAKTVLDLKERIAVSLMFRCFLVVSLHSVSELGSSERRNGAVGRDGADGAGRRESAAVFHRGGFVSIVRSRFR